MCGLRPEKGWFCGAPQTPRAPPLRSLSAHCPALGGLPPLAGDPPPPTVVASPSEGPGSWASCAEKKEGAQAGGSTGRWGHRSPQEGAGQGQQGGQGLLGASGGFQSRHSRLLGQRLSALARKPGVLGLEFWLCDPEQVIKPLCVSVATPVT